MNRRLFLQKSLLSSGTLGLLPSNFLWQVQTENNEISNPVHILPSESTIDRSLPIRYRQVHLDFHTSGQIPDIGIDFDPEKFASTLKKAHVNSVTCFGRCHHGYIYHETDLFPERVHPLTKRPYLLKEQIEACHKQNIRVPIYVTVQWDEFTAKEHPEWLMLDAEGKPFGNTTFQPGFYRWLCVLTPYRDFLKKYLSELFEKVPVDGLFLDIVGAFPNANEASIRAMRKRGLDVTNISVRRNFYEEVIAEFKADLSTFIRKHDRDCSIFYNGGHIAPNIRKSINFYSHLEVESLPSGGWGYLHFPLTSRFARTLGPDVLGMTGKFHTSWGDFHSLKNKAALEFECFSMLALNAKCSIGDQLHPRGELDSATYDLIGYVYKEVYKKEAWCENARAVTDIAVFNAEEFLDPDSPEYTHVPQQMIGAIRMLQEGQHQFDVIDSQSNLSSYKLLIMPDTIPVHETLKAKLETFIKNGGKLIASYKSGLSLEGNKFTSSLFGVKLKGEAPFSPDFLVLNEKGIGKGLPRTELVMYMKGLEVELQEAESLVDTNIPYFNRTWEHFSSHRHTPSSGKKGYPAVTKHGNIIYFMHPIFTQYADSAPSWCKKIFLNAVENLLPHPIIRIENAPSALIATVNTQENKKRYIIHFLYFVPERKGKSFDVVEDILPIYNLKTSLNITQKAKNVLTVPQGEKISFRQTGNKMIFILPKLKGHQMVEISY
jgi:hypothetical protein